MVADNIAQRLFTAYSGPGRKFRRRIEGERPATLLEENLVRGRQAEARLLLDWMRDLNGLRVLDAGCGLGLFAVDLVRAGADVTAVDLAPDFAPETEDAGVRLVEGDVRNDPWPDAAEAPEPFDVILLRDVLQDYEGREMETLLAAVSDLAAPDARMFLTLRQAVRFGWMLDGVYPPGLGGTVEFTAALRALQLATPFRLVRREEIKRRNYRSMVVEARRFDAS